MKSALALALVGCGSGGVEQKLDGMDQQSTVLAVACPASPDATIATATNAFMPMSVLIHPGQIVKFVMPSSHNAVTTGPGFDVEFGQTRCLRFTAAGTFSFRCTVHGFMGTVTVQ